MIDYFIEIFNHVCIGLIDLIPAVLVIWLVVDLISGLFFREN